jgi:pyruvate dehydrogenase E1 component
VRRAIPRAPKDIDDVDFSTGSVGIGVAQTLFSSLVQDYVKAHGWMKHRPEGRMVALIGDAEMDEGNIREALIEGWKQKLRNCWWIVDYNRQSLDAVVPVVKSIIRREHGVAGSVAVASPA